MCNRTTIKVLRCCRVGCNWSFYRKNTTLLEVQFPAKGVISKLATQMYTSTDVLKQILRILFRSYFHLGFGLFWLPWFGEGMVVAGVSSDKWDEAGHAVAVCGLAHPSTPPLHVAVCGLLVPCFSGAAGYKREVRSEAQKWGGRCHIAAAWQQKKSKSYPWAMKHALIWKKAGLAQAMGWDARKTACMLARPSPVR
jgi:hypothetical protein